MIRDAIRTNGAPAAIGPYSQGIFTDGLVFCSGQIGLDPATGELVDECNSRGGASKPGSVIGVADDRG